MFILIATTEHELFIWYLAIVINLIGTFYDFNTFILFSCKMKVSLPKKTLNQKSGDKKLCFKKVLLILIHEKNISKTVPHLYNIYF